MKNVRENLNKKEEGQKLKYYEIRERCVWSRGEKKNKNELKRKSEKPKNAKRKP